MALRTTADDEQRNLAVCARFVRRLPVMGASVSVFGGAVVETSLYASDTVAEGLDEIQFDLGEGPRWEVVRSRAPVLLPDTRKDAHEAWPLFGDALAQTPVRALFAFPLTIYGIDLGNVELYHTEPGSLEPRLLTATWQLIYETARGVLSQPRTSTSGRTDVSFASSAGRKEIHQATGMVLVQTGSTAIDALLILRAHAFATDRSVREVAGDVVARRLVFPPGPSEN